MITLEELENLRDRLEPEFKEEITDRAVHTYLDDLANSLDALLFHMRKNGLEKLTAMIYENYKFVEEG